MAKTAFKGDAVSTVAELPTVGSAAPAFTLTGTDLSDVTLDTYQGKRLVLNIFPSVDTGVCAASVRRFNELAAGLDNTAVLCVSADLPFALGRFCGAEGIENVDSASVFRGPEFGQGYGVLMTDGPLHGLLARAVVVVDASGTVSYTELVPEITQEPDYDAAVAALS
ncbi:MAG: thiol peroxidase [Austwickia sp.]|jgi:thioredoxin-dependent peroxiredoxin|nr:thiol peroxidase [Austwickia sp.]MBK8437035.1 thiol peroxidase [Austwickia sp.]MBK9100660.1 thiol peroxidase [Austwickia sp.]